MRKKEFHKQLVITIILLIFGVVISAQQIVEEIIAKVNDTVISKRDLEEAIAPFLNEIYEKYQGEERIQQIKLMKSRTLENMIQAELINYQARLYGFTASESEVQATIERIKQDNNITSDEEFERQLRIQGQTLDKLKEELKKVILQQRVFGAEIGSQIIITESEMLQYYNNNIEKYTTPEKVRISQLLFPLDDKEINALREEVTQIRNQINDANDFVAMVKQLSENPDEQQDGDVGYFQRGELLKDIEDAAFSMEVGALSPIIETDRGFYVIHVTDKKPAAEIPFDEVKKDIRQEMWQQKVNEKMDEYLQELRERSYVEIVRPIE